MTDDEIKIQRLQAENDLLSGGDYNAYCKAWNTWRDGRAAIIEECARVAESYRADIFANVVPRKEIAAAIRALKDKP